MTFYFRLKPHTMRWIGRPKPSVEKGEKRNTPTTSYSANVNHYLNKSYRNNVIAKEILTTLERQINFN